MKNLSNLPIGDLLSSPKQKQRYSDLFETRKIIPSKFLDWEYLSGLNMDFIVDLDNLGLKKYG